MMPCASKRPPHWNLCEWHHVTASYDGACAPGGRRHVVRRWPTAVLNVMLDELNQTFATRNCCELGPVAGLMPDFADKSILLGAGLRHVPSRQRKRRFWAISAVRCHAGRRFCVDPAQWNQGLAPPKQRPRFWRNMRRSRIIRSAHQKVKAAQCELVAFQATAAHRHGHGGNASATRNARPSPRPIR